MAKQKAEKKQRIKAARLLAKAKLDAAAPEEIRKETEFKNEQADRKALSDTVSTAAQRGWNLKTTMESYHRSGGKDDMAVHEAWAKMNPNMKPEMATLEDKDGKEHEVILWNGQMRPVADLTRQDKMSAFEEALTKGGFSEDEQTELWEKYAGKLASANESETVAILKALGLDVGGGSSEASEVVNINDI